MDKRKRLVEDESLIWKQTKQGEKNPEPITESEEFTSDLSSYCKDDTVSVRLIQGLKKMGK